MAYEYAKPFGVCREWEGLGEVMVKSLDEDGEKNEGLSEFYIMSPAL